MTLRPVISVVIPTRGRAASLGRCLAGLAAQTIAADEYEVIVVTDGPDPETERLLGGGHGSPPRNRPGRTRLISGPRLGNAHAKNLGIEAASGEVVLFLNDDVLPDAGLLAAHAKAHRERGGREALVVGHSPFVVPERASVFDVLLNESGLVFFYHRMVDAAGRAVMPPDHDWGYRHAWTLNLSGPRAALAGVGGFRPAIANCCYEDVELGFRCARERGMGVVFRPGALARHDHRMTPGEYLAREHRLGYSACGFAHAAPECARDLFGRDILSRGEMEYARRFVERESRGEAGALEDFERLGTLPAGVLPEEPGARGALVSALAGQQVMLKRMAFRRGLMDAANGARLAGLFHPVDGLPTAPGLAAGSGAG